MDPGPTDAADLFEGNTSQLSHGGRAFRREVAARILASGTNTDAVYCVHAADKLIEALTGRRPMPLKGSHEH